ncbi:MAG: hypothetical protein KDK63_02170, partial [Chlamydiia bacterium]|nr:hypothetical protein [Chlamydiia bacterium]
MSTTNFNVPVAYAATHPLVPAPSEALKLPYVPVAAPAGGMSAVTKVVALVAVVFFAVFGGILYFRAPATRKAN